MSRLITIDKREIFEEVIQSNESIIVKFYADWCPECKRLDIILNNLIDEYKDVSWYEVNSDELIGLAEIYGIMSIPSILIFKNGDKVAHLPSSQTKSLQAIRDFLNHKL